jgi:toxin FitB
MILVDTNVWSEATKRSPDPRVRSWAREHDDQLWLSTVVLAELRAGAAVLPVGKRRSAFEEKFAELVSQYADRILVFDESSSREYAAVLENAKRMGRPIGTADAMIAATARVHGMCVATRDLGDFAGAGVELIDPWTSAP